MKGSNSLSDEHLKDYSNHHLKYELDMLIWCTGLLAPLANVKGAGPVPWAANNAVLNSYSMHARNLIDFLYLRSLERDRIQFEEAGKEWKFVEIALEIARTFNAISGLFPPERTGDAFLALLSDDRFIMPFIRAKVIQNEQSQNIGVTIRLGTREDIKDLGDPS